MEFWGLACGDWNSRWWLLIALHYHRFVYVSHNEQHCSYPSEVMSSSLPCAPPLSLPLPISFLPLSLYLFISFFLPHCPLPPSTIHSFISSPPLSSHLTRSLSSMWVATTLLSSRTPWNVLSVLKFEKFFQGGTPDPSLVGQAATIDPHQPLQYHSMHLLRTQVLRCTLFSLRKNVLGFFGLTGWDSWLNSRLYHNVAWCSHHEIK